MNQAKTKSKKELRTVGAKLPAGVIRELDRAAKKAGRTRSSEARMRLEHSLATVPVLTGVA